MTLSPFLATLTCHATLPSAAAEARERAAAGFAGILGSGPEHDALRDALAHPAGNALLDVIFACSPYLARLLRQYPDIAAEFFRDGPERAMARLMREGGAAETKSQLMQTLRHLKGKAALLVALADISGVWSVHQVTKALSAVAEQATRRSLALLLAEGAAKGDIHLPDARDPEHGSGIIVLAVGKLGAHELNYSSDVDLIVLFDRERLTLKNAPSATQYCARLVQELVRLLQERTEHGYVFRVDLRLRPDPASTPVALSTAGALTYYETVGQNWERAALIKSRVIAGDREAGYRFLQQLAPFLWRKHLDFAAIDDIQSIKRQMDARAAPDISLPGHNIKTGLGGIREIEFFAQIHQLIWGGRILRLRTQATIETLEVLASTQLISGDTACALTQSYVLLRQVEHRLQMIDDEQTHRLPVEAERFERLALFLGYADVQDFSTLLRAHLERVHGYFAASFRGRGSLGDEGVLSFTGVEPDSRTTDTLARMGFQNPAYVSEAIAAWHRGARRATRTKRARELLTELTPTLLKAFAATPQPDHAFLRFDEFLARLPAGVQLFSLFQARHALLELIALIMGGAPALAERLSKTPSLLDTVLAADFTREAQCTEAAGETGHTGHRLFTELANLILPATRFEDEMDIIRRFAHEKNFHAGVRLICRQSGVPQVQRYLSDVANAVVRALLHRTEMAFAEKHAGWRAGGLCVVALGRFGAQEMMFGSDIDLIFIYDAAWQEAALGDLHALYNKLSQRFITALTVMTNEGRLYSVDTRLRPSGKDGALAITLAAFDQYFKASAWSFEFMALTRARVVTGHEALAASVDAALRRHITQERDKASMQADIVALRAKISREFGDSDPWNVKYARGGLMDFDFIAQYHSLTQNFGRMPGVTAVFLRLGDEGALSKALMREAMEAYGFLTRLLTLIRLLGDGRFDPDHSPAGVKTLLATSLSVSDFPALAAQLQVSLNTGRALFNATFPA